MAFNRQKCSYLRLQLLQCLYHFGHSAVRCSAGDLAVLRLLERPFGFRTVIEANFRQTFDFDLEIGVLVDREIAVLAVAAVLADAADVRSPGWNKIADQQAAEIEKSAHLGLD